MSPLTAKDRAGHHRRTIGAGWKHVLALAGILAGSAALAADLQVNPIMLEFAPGEQSQALWLTNSGSSPLKAQVRVAAWTQSDDEDVQTPSRDLVASPAILEVPPGERQLVRLVRPKVGPVQTEQAYRLTVDELPQAESEAKAGLNFLLRYSIPVFVTPDDLPPLGPTRRVAEPAPVDLDALSIQLEPSTGETSLLRIGNPGRQRVRFSDLSWVDGAGNRIAVVPGLLGYALAGQSRQWNIPLPASLRSRGGNLRARINDEASDRILPLEEAGR